MTSIKEILVLSRIQTAALTAIVPVFGYWLSAALTEGDVPLTGKWLDLVLLGLIGFLVHVFGFVHNEIMDTKFDSKNPIHNNKPLVKGTIGRGFAGILVIICIILSIAFLHVYFNVPEATLLLTISILMGSIYNIIGKKIPAMDVFLALWAFFYFLAGARLAGPLEPELYVMGCMGALQIMFNNGIIGGLKDAVADRNAGARTMATELGVRDSEGGLAIPNIFKIISWIIKFGQVASGLVIILYFHDLAGFSGSEKVIFLAFVVLLILTMIIFQGLALTRKMERRKMLRVFAVHELATVSYTFTIAIPFIGVAISAFMLLAPLIWFILANRILYRTTMIPRI
ncbi:MAG: UbiA family prenyltransferase [Candidatus Thermoplasmatota archaeon]|nr:UbiA family prenyltransferase [Candidatus Thermoplasmatota archaeon]